MLKNVQKLKMLTSLLTTACFFGALTVYAGSGRTEISSADLPFIISSSGSYVLTENLQGTSGQDGITISSSDVTLDLNGFTLLGASSASGILAAGSPINIILQNGQVSGWGEDGVNLSSVSNALLQGIVSTGNGQDGIEVGANTVLHQCQAFDNGQNGIKAGDVSVFVDCVSRSNALAGIVAGSFSSINSTASRDNSGAGFVIGNYSTLVKVATRFNGSNGVEVAGGSLISDSIAHNNTGFGFRLLGDGNRIQDSTAYGNGEYGVYATRLSMIESVSSRINTNGGFRIGGKSFVLNSIADQNGGPGFWVQGTESRIEANHATANTFGFDVDGSANLILRNTAYTNTTAYSISTNNFSLIVTNPGSSSSNFDNPWTSYEY